MDLFTFHRTQPTPLWPMRIVGGLLLGCMMLLALPLHAQAQLGSSVQEEVVLDEIVAVVNGQLILRSDVRLTIARLTRGRPLPAARRDQIRSRVLQQLIDQEVMLVHAQNDTTITVSENRVEQVLDQRIQALASQLGGEEQLQELYGMSILEIKNDYREQVHDQLLTQQLYRRRQQKVRITPSEVQAWFERIPQDSLPTIPTTVRVAHIVRYPKPDPAARKKAKEKITAIRDSILAGASFEEMARKHSEDPGSASRGGRYKNFNVNDLVPELGAVAAQLEPGEVSQVFESQFGFHIMRLNERTGEIVDFNHILITIDENQTLSKKTVSFLKTLRDSVLHHNASFEKLAAQYSEDPSSSNQGGFVTNPATGNRDLPVAQLGSSWQSTLDTMEAGEISKPARVELQNGETAWHIVRLQERTPEHVANLKDDYARIQQAALRDKQQRVMQQWLAELREDVFIDIRDEKLARLSSSQ